MKAVRILSGRQVRPFGDPVAAVPVLNVPLARVQEHTLAPLGIEVLPDGADLPAEPHLVFSDRTWFSTDTVRRLLAAGPGRLRVEDGPFWEATGPLQQVEAPGLYELGLHPGGSQGGLSDLAPVTVDLGLRDLDMPQLHVALAHAHRPVRVGPAAIHQVDHWSHVLRINQLALAVRGEEARLAWEGAPWWGKLWFGARTLLKAGKADGYAIAAALTERGQGVKVHPSAVVELSWLADGVEIGPQAVVRASVLGPGTRVEEHATVVMSSLGERCHVGRYGFVNLCTAWPGAQISAGGGYQMSVFGRDSFVAWGATGLDLSFGRSIRSEHPDHAGEFVDTTHHFLGVAIGHRARVANAVRIHHGMSVPNDAFLVAQADDLLRRWDDAPVDQGPMVVRGGRPVPVRRS